MSLRNRVLLIVSLVIAVYSLAHFFIQEFSFAPSYYTLEYESAKKDMERCVRAFQREMQHLESLTKDWASWDDTYQFVKDRNEDYIASNLIDLTFVEYKFNLIWICDEAGEVIWGKVLDLGKNEVIHIPEFSENDFSKSPFYHTLKGMINSIEGILITGKGPMLIASRNILRSDNTGSSRGIFIMGRFLDEGLIQKIAKQTQVNVKFTTIKNSDKIQYNKILSHITPNSPIYIFEDESDHLQIYKTIDDLQGQGLLLIRADIPKEISTRGETAMRFGLISILTIGVIMVFVLMFLLQRTVVNPISELTDHAISISETNKS